MLDGFNHYDGVVDYDADREDDAEERDVVDRKSEGLHRGEGANQRNRNGDQRDERRAPALEKDEDDENDESDRFEERLLHFMNRLAHRGRRVVLDFVIEPGWKALLEFSHLRAHRVGGRKRVRTGTLEDADRRGRLAAELAVDGVVARRQLHPSDIAHASDLAVRAGLDDDFAKLLLIGESALGADRVLKGGRALRDRLCANDAGGDLHILLLDRLDNILRGQSARGNLVRIKPEAHRIFSRPEDIDIADAVDPSELIANLEERVIAGEDRIERSIGRNQVHDHGDIGRLLFRRHADALHLGRQRGNGDGHTILHEHLRRIEIGAELESDVQRHVAVARALRRHVEHVLDAVDLLLDRRGNRFRDHLGIAARVVGRDLNGRRRDLRILRDRQSARAQSLQPA